MDRLLGAPRAAPVVTKPIQQSVTLPAKAAALFRTFLDAKAHAAVVGSKVSISAREGAKWKAYRGVTEGWKKYYWRPWKKYLA